ncbi:MAG: winged helix-turn-helix domain-containing protein [Burkholderiaceae bacterium]
MEQTVTPAEIGTSRIQLGGFVLDLSQAELRSADHHLSALRKQALEVLLVLGAHAGHVVNKGELMSRVWPNVVVGEDSLAQAIAEIRRVLGDGEHRLVRTVARRGYMLVPETSHDAAGPTPPSSADRPAPRRHWGWAAAVSFGVIAAVAGGLVFAPQPGGDSSATGAWPGGIPTRSLVVLPLAIEAGEVEQRWFADALTGDLTSSLSRWPGLFVIGRGTASRYKDQALDPRAVARELGVRYVIRGEVRRDGDRVRLDLALIDGESGAQHWGQRYDVERARLAQSIDDINGGVARTLAIELGKSVGQRIETMKPEQVAADDLAMQGIAVLLRSLGKENLAEARRLFEQAVAKDPDSVRGLGGVSVTNSMGVIFQWLPDRDAAVRRSEEALARLESIDANAYITLDARATLTNLRADWEGLLTVASAMLMHFPADATSHHHRCSALLRLGRFDESIPSCERSIRISPRDSRVGIWHGLIAMDHFMQARYARAVEHARHTVTGLPNIPFFWLLLAASLAQDGRQDEAVRLLKDFKARYPDFALSTVATIWPATNPDFVAGRDRIVTTVRALGLK